jgi:hypothetical protein
VVEQLWGAGQEHLQDGGASMSIQSISAIVNCSELSRINPLAAELFQCLQMIWAWGGGMPSQQGEPESQPESIARVNRLGFDSGANKCRRPRSTSTKSGCPHSTCGKHEK